VAYTLGSFSRYVYTKCTWGSREDETSANEAELLTLIRPLGTQLIRARRLISLSGQFLKDPPRYSDFRPSRSTVSSNLLRRREKYPPTPISHLPGAGPYALDSYRIFCTNNENRFSEEWKAVMPGDKELIRYLVCCQIYSSNSSTCIDSDIRNGNGPLLSARHGPPT
jgi:hypothetical protein